MNPNGHLGFRLLMLEVSEGHSFTGVGGVPKLAVIVVSPLTGGVTTPHFRNPNMAQMPQYTDRKHRIEMWRGMDVPSNCSGVWGVGWEGRKDAGCRGL